MLHWFLYLRRNICPHVIIDMGTVYVMLVSFLTKKSQQCLQVTVEEEVADSQCGFQCKCRCIDMI